MVKEGKNIGRGSCHDRIICVRWMDLLVRTKEHRHMTHEKLGVIVGDSVKRTVIE